MRARIAMWHADLMSEQIFNTSPDNPQSAGTLLRFSVLALTIFVSALIIFPRIATSIQSTDGPELAYLAALGGLAHPPGYPVYTMLGSAAVSIFPANPYYTMSCLSALATIITSCLLGLICTRLSRSPLIGWLLAIAWTVLPAVLDVATDADVFAFHHLLIALLLVATLFLPYASDRRGGSYVYLGLAFGFGMAHHLMMVLWAPLMLGQILQGRRPRSGRARLLLTSAGVVIGYSSILLIRYRFQSNPSLSLAPVENVAEFIVCALRLGYGLLSSGVSLDEVQQHWLIPFLTWLLDRSPLFLIGVFAIPVLLLSRTTPLVKGVALTGIAHLWFCWQLTSEVGLTDIGWIGRFFGAPALSLAALTAILMQRVSFPFRLLALLLLLPPLWQLPITLADTDRSSNYRAELEVHTLLLRAPINAIFLTSSDLLGFGGIYLQQIEHLRPDLLLVHDSRLGSPHYRSVLAEQLRARGYAWQKTPDSIESLIADLCRLRSIVVTESVPDKDQCQLG